jgi:serine/threonine protein kinase
MNIFRKNQTLKIGDFGLAKSLDISIANTVSGTFKYMAPEIFQNQQSYSLKADIWSLGVCFWEMMSLKVDCVPYLAVYQNLNFYYDLEFELLNLVSIFDMY